MKKQRETKREEAKGIEEKRLGEVKWEEERG